MGLFDKFKRNKSDAGGESLDSIEFEGYDITPAPKKQGGTYSTAGYIRKSADDGEVKEHYFIRADTHSDIDQAREHTIFKAKQIIEQLGDRMFDSR